jgi:hypothetical protein
VRTTATIRAIQSTVALLRAVPALALVDIVNGPPIEWDPLTLANDQYGDGRCFVFIGADLDSDEGDSATGSQAWAGTGFPRDKDENFTISCVAMLFDGSTDIEQAQNDIEAVLIAIETQLLAHLDLSLDSTPGPVLFAGFAGIDHLRQFYTDRGLTISAQFDIACRAYLTS